MAALIALLLTVGTVLAAAGTLGFYAVATTAPDTHDLAFTRRMATLGRRMIYAGMPMLAGSHVSLAGPMAGIVAGVGFVAAASYLTMAPLGSTREPA